MERGQPAATSSPDWLSLPAGVLQHIFARASTFQTPGSCLAALVCSTWRAAAAGCRGIRLLYRLGSPAADASFLTWVGVSSQQLEALTLYGHHQGDGVRLVVGALAEAAAAAQAAGAPLQLHTLRVLRRGCDVATAGRLLAALPELRCLQLAPTVPVETSAEGLGELLQQALGPLQQAQQLQHLYLTGPRPTQLLTGRDMAAATVGLLPISLRRLDWFAPFATADHSPLPDLSPLTQLTFMRLWAWLREDPVSISTRLPPGLQELELLRSMPPKLGYGQLEEPPEKVTAWDTLGPVDLQQQLGLLTNLKRLALEAVHLQGPAVHKGLAQHPKLSALGLTRGTYVTLDPALLAARGIKNLQQLDLDISEFGYPDTPLLAALTAVTRLSVRLDGDMWQISPNGLALVGAMGRMAGLRQLSISGAALQAGFAWLEGLKQLRVLSVHFRDTFVYCDNLRVLQELLGWCSQESLPPKLQLLEVTGITAAWAEAWQLLHRLRDQLGRSGCELVDRRSRDDLADLAQQLAGLPAALQQVFAHT